MTNRDMPPAVYGLHVINRQSGEAFSDTVEERAECTMRRSRGVVYISYETGGAKVMIKITDGAMEMRRLGDFGSVMKFVPGSVTEFEYRTPYVSIPMRVWTSELGFETVENGGSIELCYTLFAGGDKILNKMTIKMEGRL